MINAPLDRHPAWYGAVMGTAGAAVAIASVGAGLGLDQGVVTVLAGILVVTATVLAVLLAPRYLRRLSPQGRLQLRRELGDPAAGALLGTLPGGLLILSVALVRVFADSAGSWLLWVATILAFAGTALAVVLGLAWALSIADTAEPSLELVNGGWFIPPVVNVIVPLAFVGSMALFDGTGARTLFLVGLMFWGSGILLFIVVLALLVARMALRGPQPVMMAPSQWIPLAPAGIAGVALLRSFHEAALLGIIPAVAVDAAAVVASLLAGFGVWWTLLALALLVGHRRRGGLAFHPGWWGFTFPLASMTVALALLGQYWGVELLTVMAVIWLVGALSAWVTVAERSVRATIAARSAQPPPAGEG